jgi:hypothetical protein
MEKAKVTIEYGIGNIDEWSIPDERLAALIDFLDWAVKESDRETKRQKAAQAMRKKRGKK